MDSTYQIEFNKPGHVWFIGIGGISMSGLAEILLQEGFQVGGSDAKESSLTDHLQSLGAEIVIGQKAENISGNEDFAVYTAAVHPDNPEYRSCMDRKIPLLRRAELLGQVMKRYRHSIAVSGTHGKTTTTSMITHILLAAKEDPTVSVGGILPIINGNIRIGGKDMFVTEACEYTDSFLSFYPTMEVILNIEADHLDYFKNLENIRASFHKFVGKLPDNGTVVISNEIKDYGEIVKDFRGKVITTGFHNAHVSAEDIAFDNLARPAFTFLIDGVKKDRVQLQVPGEHNVHNALAAIAVALELGIDPSVFEKGLSSFGGAARRFEKKGMIGKAILIDDYAHHPQEIEATLKAAKHYPHKRIICIFQPHTYTRTKALLPQFAKALSLADKVVLADIFPARETDTLGVSSADVAELICRDGGDAVFLPTFDRIENWLLENLTEGDLCITMGAGDIYKVGDELLGR